MLASNRGEKAPTTNKHTLWWGGTSKAGAEEGAGKKHNHTGVSSTQSEVWSVRTPTQHVCLSNGPMTTGRCVHTSSNQVIISIAMPPLEMQ